MCIVRCLEADRGEAFTPLYIGRRAGRRCRRLPTDALGFIHFYGPRVRLLKCRHVCIADLATGSTALTLGDVWLRH